MSLTGMFRMGGVSEGFCMQGMQLHDSIIHSTQSPFGARLKATPSPGTLDINDDGSLLPSAPFEAAADFSLDEVAQYQPLPFRASSSRGQRGTHCSHALADCTLVKVLPLTFVTPLNGRCVPFSMIRTLLCS
jgi:hypothetical protein